MKVDTVIVHLLTRSTLSMKVDTVIVHPLTRSTLSMKVDTVIVHQASLKRIQYTAVFALICFIYLRESQIQKNNYIHSNKFFHNFHLSESNFTCPGLWTSGLALRLKQDLYFPSIRRKSYYFPGSRSSYNNILQIMYKCRFCKVLSFLPDTGQICSQNSCFMSGNWFI